MAVLIFLVALVLFLWIGGVLLHRGGRHRGVGEIEDHTIGDAQRWSTQQGMYGHDNGGGPTGF